MKEFTHQIKIDQESTSTIPGYLLVEKSHDPSISSKIIHEGIKLFFGGFGQFTYIYDIGRYLFALLMPEKNQKLNCVSLYRDKGNFAFIEGTFYDFDLLRRNKEVLISTELAQEILNLCLNENYEKLKEYNGRYSGFCFIEKTDTLVVITDSFGANRVFVYEDARNFAITNNIFALSKNPGFKLSINEESIAQILHYEYPAYRQTEFNEIELVLPSDIFIRRNKTNIRRKKYQSVDRTVRKSDKEYINELRTSLNSFFVNISSYLQEPIGLFLSKGKDSRLFLPFLEKNNIDYLPFVFKEETGVFDYPQVKKIVELLGKDIHVLEKHSIDRKLSFMFSMSTTPTTPWLALGKMASEYTNTALMGVYGESSSGKLGAYRSYGINDLESSMQTTILGNSRDITQEEVLKWIPYYKKYDTVEAFRKLYNEYPPVDLLFDYDTYQDIDHRSFRNALVILFKAQHFLTPISPYMDKNVSDVYHRLPNSLLKSQLAHTIIASEEEKSNKIKSTAFPISLKNEKYARTLLLEIVKVNALLKDILMSSHKKKYRPFVDSNNFIPKSQYFRNIFLNKDEVIGNPRILTRLYNIDEYLYLNLEDNDLNSYFKPPIIIHSELNVVGERIKG